MTQLSISKIRTDGGTQPRAELDLSVVGEYAEAMERGVDFPPISVVYDGEEYWLYDGFHRLRAAMKRERETIEAEVEQGTQEDAVWRSLAANKDHGLRRSQKDKRRAIKRALKHTHGAESSDRSIARHVGVSPKTVSKYREQLTGVEIPQVDERKGSDGKTYDTSNIGSSSGTPDAAQEESEMQPEGGAGGRPYDPDTRGDGAPNRSSSTPSGGLGGPSGEHTAGASTEEYVDAQEAIRRVCAKLSSICEDPSRLNAELVELAQRAEEDELPAKGIDKLRTKLEKAAKRLLSHAENFHPTPESDPLYSHD